MFIVMPIRGPGNPVKCLGAMSRAHAGGHEGAHPPALRRGSVRLEPVEGRRAKHREIRWLSPRTGETFADRTREQRVTNREGESPRITPLEWGDTHTSRRFQLFEIPCRQRFLRCECRVEFEKGQQERHLRAEGACAPGRLCIVCNPTCRVNGSRCASIPTSGPLRERDL
jgi:hypothetical protein